jgi:hypothetical protein
MLNPTEHIPIGGKEITQTARTRQHHRSLGEDADKMSTSTTEAHVDPLKIRRKTP